MKTKNKVKATHVLGALLGLGAVLAAAEKAKQNKLTTNDLNKFTKKDLILFIDELETRKNEMRNRVQELKEEIETLQEEKSKAQRWAYTRNKQVGQLINAVENMAASNNLNIDTDA